jgi:hypothetical protein
MFPLPFFKIIVLGAVCLIKMSICTTWSSCNHFLNQMVALHVTVRTLHFYSMCPDILLLYITKIS